MFVSVAVVPPRFRIYAAVIQTRERQMWWRLPAISSILLMLSFASVHAQECGRVGAETCMNGAIYRCMQTGGVTGWILRDPYEKCEVRTQSVAGTYAGMVDRRSKGERLEARTYRLIMNPDASSGQVLIFNPNGTLRSDLVLTGRMSDNSRFEGTTTVINAPPGYIPDRVRLVFSPDRATVQWYHNDGTTEGSGTLSRAGR